MPARRPVFTSRLAPSFLGRGAYQKVAACLPETVTGGSDRLITENGTKRARQADQAVQADNATKMEAKGREEMEVVIGFKQSTRDLTVETDAPAAEIQEAVSQALENGGKLTLTDRKGGNVFVSADAIAFVEVHAAESRRVGFGL